MGCVIGPIRSYWVSEGLTLEPWGKTVEKLTDLKLWQSLVCSRAVKNIFHWKKIYFAFTFYLMVFHIICCAENDNEVRSSVIAQM